MLQFPLVKVQISCYIHLATPFRVCLDNEHDPTGWQEEGLRPFLFFRRLPIRMIHQVQLTLTPTAPVIASSGTPISPTCSVCSDKAVLRITASGMFGTFPRPEHARNCLNVYLLNTL